VPLQKTRSRVFFLYKYFQDFSGGQNSLFNPALLKENESPSCQNVRLRAKGTVSKRGGTKTKNLSPYVDYGVQGFHALYRKDGTKYLLFVINGTLYSEASTDDWTGVVTVRTGLSTTNKVRFITYLDKAYVADGVNTLFRTDGTTYETIAAAPVAGLVMDYKNHIFVVNSTTPNRLIFSDLGDPDDWPALNFIEVNSDDGDRLTALESSYRGRLLIWKERTAWQLFGDSVSNFELDGPRCNYGTVSQESVRIIGDLVYWLAREGIVAWNLSSSVLISEKIDPDIDRINQPYIAKSAGFAFRNEYMISCPCDGSVTNNRTFVFDTLRAAWIVDVGYYPAVWGSWAPAGQDLLYSGHITQGRLVEHEQEDRNDDGAAIDAWWTTREEDFELDTPKVFRGLRIHFETQNTPSNIEVWISRDHSAYELLATIDTQVVTSVWDSALWDKGVWDEAATAKVYGLSDWFRATTVSYRFRNRTLDDNFGLLRWGAFYSGRQPTARYFDDK